VTLLGEVLFPGEYVLTSRNETLLKLIERAGGFTPEAFPRGTIFLRASIAQRLEQLNVRSQLEKSTPLVVDSLGHPKRLSFVEYESGSVSRIAIDVERLRETNGAEGDLVLEHGDQILVPSTPSGISVVGAVGINGTIQFRENADVEYYIDRAGGFTRRADEDGTRLVRANGMAYSGGGTLGQKVGLGDIIAVPTKVEREGHFTRDLVTVLTVVTASVTAIILVSKI
jgi:protein involved in polysaccharide export with SLBB domain